MPLFRDMFRLDFGPDLGFERVRWMVGWLMRITYKNNVTKFVKQDRFCHINW